MNNPNSLNGGEQQNNSETGFENVKSFEEHMKNEGLENTSKDEVAPKTSEEKAKELASLRSNVMSQYKEEQSIKAEAEVPKAKREKAHDPDSEDVVHEPEGVKPGYEEIVKRGKNAKLAITKEMNKKRTNAEDVGIDYITEHVAKAEEAIGSLTDGVYPDVVELGEGTLGKLEVIEKALSREDFSELLKKVNAPVNASYNEFRAAVTAQRDKTLEGLDKERSYIGDDYKVMVNGKETSGSFKSGVKDIADFMLAVKNPETAKRTPSEVLAQEDKDNRLRSDGAKTLESFWVAARDKKIETTKEDKEILGQITELENICNQLGDVSEARTVCQELRKDLSSESGVDFSKAVKMIAKIEKKLAKQEKKLQKSIKKIDFGSLQSRVNAAM